MAIILIPIDLTRDERFWEITETIELLHLDFDWDEEAHQEWVEREHARFERVEQHMKNRTFIDL